MANKHVSGALSWFEGITASTLSGTAPEQIMDKVDSLANGFIELTKALGDLHNMLARIERQTKRPPFNR
ncbi:hypothetical protein ACFL4G_08555 [Thermodesulfobacteriota bacterium]